MLEWPKEPEMTREGVEAQLAALGRADRMAFVALLTFGAGMYAVRGSPRDVGMLSGFALVVGWLYVLGANSRMKAMCKSVLGILPSKNKE